LIWIELKKFRKEYINVSETLKNKKQVAHESISLKEEVEILQRALSVSNFINTIISKYCIEYFQF
jgi:cell shape-determining protein MreC